MMQAIKIPGTVVLLMLTGLAVAADVDNGVVEQRARLQHQRQQIEAGYEAALRECQDRFQVTDCELAAKAKRRAALAPILTREQQLDRADREEQARASRERLAVKQLRHEGEAELRQSAAPNGAASSGDARSASHATAKSISAPVSRVDVSKAKQEQAARKAQRQKAERQERIEKAREHEAEVRAREAALIARGKRAAPLPVPGASADAASSAVKR